MTDVIYANRVHESCSGTGAANLTLLGALSGKATFTSKIATGAVVPYVLLDGNGVDWEVGFGTLASATELQRTTVKDSSATSGRVNSETAGTPVKISLSSNQHEVFIAPFDKTVFSRDTDGALADPSAVRAAIFVDTIAAMTALSGLEDGETVIVMGGSVFADGDGGVYYWDEDDVGAESPPVSYEHDSETGLFKRVQFGSIDADAMPLSYLETSTSLASNSDTRVPSTKAVKAYADALIAANDAMVFKGVIDCSANPNYPAANRGDTYRVSVAGKIGGASGVNVEAGDVLICLTDSTSAGTQAGVGASWTIAQANIDGAVIGPASAVTASALALFDGTTGRLIKQAAGVTVDADNTLFIRPTAASVASGIDVLQSGPTTGSHGDGSGNLYFNKILVNGDQANITNTGYALAVLYGLGGSNLQGQRCALVGRFVLNTASNASNPLKIYFGTSGEAQASVGDGGTDTASGAAGRFGGLYASSIAAAGATNLFSIDGLEINTSLRATSSARFHIGIKIAPWADSAVDAAELAAAIQITSQTGALPYKHFGVVFDANSVGGGQPVGSAGTLIGTLGSVSCAVGLSFTSATFSGNAIETPGFAVGNAGNVTITKASATLTVDASSGNAFFVIDREAANIGGISWKTANSERWRFAATNDAESGANAGSNLVLQAYDDSGTLLRNQFTFVRSTGTVTFGGEVVVSSTQPALRLDETDGGTNQRYSYIYQASAVLHFAFATDGFSITDWLTVTRSAGAGVLAAFAVPVSSTASLTAHSATAIPAGGTAGAGLLFSSTTNFGVFFGSGAPTLSANEGSLYLGSDRDGSLFVCTGTTNWVELSPYAIRPLFKLTANMNSSGVDQQFTKIGQFGNYMITGARGFDGDASCANAVGGIFSGAGGTGNTLVASFTWSAFNAAALGQSLTITAGTLSARIPNSATPYLRLTTPHGSAAALTIIIEGYLIP